MRSLLVDGMLEALLRDDPAVRRAYHMDPTYHSEMVRLRDAATRAHRSLMATDSENADSITRVLLAGFPDPQTAAQRIADHDAHVQALMSGKS